MLDIGQNAQEFDCSCKEGRGCRKTQAIEIRLNQVGGEQLKQRGGQLRCACRPSFEGRQLTLPPSERKTLEKIMLEEIPRPHRPGN